MEKKFSVLFSNLCCSHCKHGFDEQSVSVKRQEKGLLVTHLTCQNCGKSFGIAFVGSSDFELKNGETASPLEVQSGPDPISVDEVLDAHKFIKNLDEHWLDYLPKTKK